jgi:magnesium chelatase subunit I
VGDTLASSEYMRLMKQVEGLAEPVQKLDAGKDPALVASAVEFVLEGLHLNKRLNKDKVAGRVQYRG